MLVVGSQVSKSHHLQKLRFYGDEFVFNTVSGMCYRVTPSAGLLLRALSKGADLDQLVDLLQDEYDVERSAAMRDVELLLNHLVELGVIEKFTSLKQAPGNQ